MQRAGCYLLIGFVVLFCFVSATFAESGNLLVGWKTVDISPPSGVSVNLQGQYERRITSKAIDPLSATVLALESVNDDGNRNQAIMISIDAAFVPLDFTNRLKKQVKAALPDIDADMLTVCCTHTHTAPGFDTRMDKYYRLDELPEVAKAPEYGNLIIGRLVTAVVEAWKNRAPGGVSWALGYAVVAQNRRPHYFDGTTSMYGQTSRDDFDCFEGYEDHGLEMVYFWDENKKLTGMIINLPCPSQETEGLSEISADFWHEVRVGLHEKYGQDIHIYPQTAASGDQSSHPLIRKAADEIMLQRKGISRRQELANRIIRGVEEVMPYAKEDIQTNPVFCHRVFNWQLPLHQGPDMPFYEVDPIHELQYHVIRLGDVAMVTMPYEVFLDYGIRIKGRSRAILTLTVQVSDGLGGYLPTERGIAGGGYSADQFLVGPEGGQYLVDQAVQEINALWEQK